MSRNNPTPNQSTIANCDSYYATDAERAVCSACALEPQAVFEVADILTADMFSDPLCAKTWKAIMHLYDKGDTVDLITVHNALQEIDAQSAQDFLTNLSGIVSSAGNILSYALLVKEAYIRRTFAVKAQQMLSLSANKSRDIADILDTAGNEIDDLIAGAYSRDEATHIYDCCMQARQSYLDRRTAHIQGVSLGITTGLRKLDDTTGGWKPGELVIVAARPAVGKTAMMLHFALSAAKAGHNATLFNLEMTKGALTERLIVGQSDVDADRAKSGTLTDTEEVAYFETANELSQLPLTIVDTALLSMRQIRNIATRLHRQGKCDILFIDYLQLVDMRTDNRHYNREQEVSATSRAAKVLAKDLNIPVVLLSQLNRSVEQRTEKKPILSDLRESGAIEQDADMVMFIHRPESYENKGELILAKHRNGKVGSIEFGYNDSVTRIYNIENNPF